VIGAVCAQDWRYGVFAGGCQGWVYGSITPWATLRVRSRLPKARLLSAALWPTGAVAGALSAVALAALGDWHEHWLAPFLLIVVPFLAGLASILGMMLAEADYARDTLSIARVDVVTDLGADGRRDVPRVSGVSTRVGLVVGWLQPPHGQRTEDRGQKTEDRGQKTEVRRQRSEVSAASARRAMGPRRATRWSSSMWPMAAGYFFFASSGGSSMSFDVMEIGAPFSGMSMCAVHRMPFTTACRKALMPKLS
jgi:hypothetical protein